MNYESIIYHYNIRSIDNIYSEIKPVEFKKRTVKAVARKRDIVKDDIENEIKDNNIDNLYRDKEFNKNNEESNEINIIDKNKDSNNKEINDDNYVPGAAISTVFESTKDSKSFNYGGSATHYNEIDTSVDRDARSVLERKIKLSNELSNNLDSNDDKIYRGKNAYQSFVKADLATVGANKITGTQGPVRAPTFLRAISRFDYQPDICKDFKETGFCGFGDTCKFLHDRSDYKSGWQLEREWEANQAKKKKLLEDAMKKVDKDGNIDFTIEDDNGETNYEINDDDITVDLPFACYICKESFTNPIVTICGHYFCLSCIQAKGGITCPICNKLTNGVFNRSIKLEKRINESKNGSINYNVKVTNKPIGSWETS